MSKKLIPHTKAADDFVLALLDVKLLGGFYDEETKEQRAKPFEVDVLKRAGIILAVTGWEAYIEDTIILQFEKRIELANSPKDIEGAFSFVAREWLDSKRKPNPPDLARWTDSGWKDVITKKFREDIERLNTPNSVNIRTLSRRYLSTDITAEWKWRGVSSKQACQKLDALIQLRGRVVHRSREVLARRALVSRRQLTDALRLTARLADCTELTFK